MAVPKIAVCGRPWSVVQPAYPPLRGPLWPTVYGDQSNHLLHQCMLRGRFVFGTASTMTGYAPVDHFLWLIGKTRHWGDLT